MTTITIDRPPVNAMSRAVVAALESALDALATDATTHVALLRGAGPRGFSAGADISEFPALLEPNADTRGEGIQRLADRVEAFPKPIIVAIHGFCMGGALTIIAGVKIPELDAGVCFYGIPPTEAADPRHMKIPLQGHFANQDDWCTPPAVNALEVTLKEARANYELFRYDAQHGFFNEQRPEVYNAEASQQAWTRLLGFLNKHL